MDEQALHAATFDVKSRHWAHLCLGYRKLSESDPIGAARHFEQSLLFNAEDHLAWLFKAICDRLAGHVDDERPELLNAHFLAPLEPGLRAESYLAAPSQVKDKSPLLNAFEETPEAFVEVACLLLEAELWEESAKWLDEALRHADLAMLRYLLAYAYLQGSRMEVQAAEQLQVASRLDFAPPFPWRPIEKRALETLASRFPDDPKLKSMLQMSPSMPSIGGSV